MGNRYNAYAFDEHIRVMITIHRTTTIMHFFVIV